MNILFVCTGNTCRSFLAEVYTKTFAREMGLNGIEVYSCGTGASSIYQVPDIIKEILKEDNIELPEHISTLVNMDLVKKADIILVMDKLHLLILENLFPSVKNKIFLLKQYIASENHDYEINDPIGQSDDVYRQCAVVIKECIKKLIKKIK